MRTRSAILFPVPGAARLALGNYPVLSVKSDPRLKWTCELCRKKLSSKRSYNEHLNVHTNMRPFACKQCTYSSASQMGLRRHNFRYHIPRNAWNYQCPYCNHMFMEPTSYKQHIASYHYGLSTTFGCPVWRCTFTTSSSSYFREHLGKHQLSPNIHEEAAHRLFRFAVDDDLGVGYGQRSLDIRRMHVLQEKELLSRTRNDGTNAQMKLPMTEMSLQPWIDAEEVDLLNSDIDTVEIINSNLDHCLHVGMTEPELD